MNEVIGKARELAISIIESDEYKKFQQLQDDIRNADLLDSISDFEKATMIVESGTFEITNKVFMDAMSIIDDAKDNQLIHAYLSAKKELAALFDTINTTIGHITGMDTGSKGCGGCDGCSSCHSCK